MLQANCRGRSDTWRRSWPVTAMVFAASALFPLAGCKPSATSSEKAAETQVEPEFAQRDGDIYMYIGVRPTGGSDLDPGAPIVTFRYLGREGNSHKLELLADDGTRLSVVECAEPCRVAKQVDPSGAVTRVAVEPSTILAAAFRDATRGLLVPANDPSPRASPMQAPAVAPTLKAPPGTDPSTAEANWRGKVGNCRLRVNGRIYIDGRCWVRLEDGGSFQIMSFNERFFAQVSRSGKEALGFWNETPGSSHAQTPLGSLTRAGGCWQNQAAEICAWDTK